MEFVRGSETVHVGPLVHEMVRTGRKTWHAQREVTGTLQPKLYSLKQIRVTDEVQAENVTRELAMLFDFRHQTIVKVFCCWTSYDVEEGGQLELPLSSDVVHYDLRTMLMLQANREHHYPQQEPELSDSQRWKWTLQLLQCIEYLHSKEKVHRDLNPWNIFLSETGGILLMDFEQTMTQKLGKRAFGVEVPGAPRLSASCLESMYSAPELGDRQVGYDNKVDIFSWALVTVLLWLGSDIGSGSLINLNDIEGVAEILEQTRASCEAPSGWARKHFRLNSLVTKALHPDPRYRPTATSMIKSLRFGEALFSDVRFINVRYNNQAGKRESIRQSLEAKSKIVRGCVYRNYNQRLMNAQRGMKMVGFNPPQRGFLTFQGGNGIPREQTPLAFYQNYDISSHGMPTRAVHMQIRRSTVELQNLASSRINTAPSASMSLDGLTGLLPRLDLGSAPSGHRYTQNESMGINAIRPYSVPDHRQELETGSRHQYQYQQDYY